ncbi:MAG: hypothetical protein HRT61_12605, partial [Ekhidna sp.]|nr:hypothetical protein [Ekhidna sp.]
QTPIAMSIEANPTFTNNAFSTSDNRFDAIGLIGANVVGDGTLTKRNFTDIDNVTYVMLGDITIPEGNTLTI